MVLHSGKTIFHLVVDYWKQDVYWLERVDKVTTIRYKNLYGGEVKTFNITGMPFNCTYFEYLEVDEKYVYFMMMDQNFIDKNVRRARKMDGLFDQDFGISTLDRSGILILKNPGNEIADHPCKDGNGG